MGKFNIYAIGYGIDPKTQKPVYGLKVNTWEECKPYIIAVEGARYKGFLTVPEADKWLEKVAAELEGKTKEENTPVVTSSVSSSINIAIPQSMEYDDDFLAICKSLGVSAKRVCLYLQREFVAQQSFLSKEANGLPFD